jgi:hypothetical protein
MDERRKSWIMLTLPDGEWQNYPWTKGVWFDRIDRPPDYWRGNLLYVKKGDTEVWLDDHSPSE